MNLSGKAPLVVPQIGDIITGRVIKISTKFALVDILIIGNTIPRETFNGKIRSQDVRSFEVDSVLMYKSFRPGDIIRAKVISLGDARSYYLSTAPSEFGVVIANSVSGHPMIPISYKEMQCSQTKIIEPRKVAKPDDFETLKKQILDTNKNVI